MDARHEDLRYLLIGIASGATVACVVHLLVGRRKPKVPEVYVEGYVDGLQRRPPHLRAVK